MLIMAANPAAAALTLLFVAATLVVAQPTNMVPCPTNSTWAPAAVSGAGCVCDAGSTGQITWDPVANSWTGSCVYNPASACGNPAINRYDPTRSPSPCVCDSSAEINKVMTGISAIEVGGATSSQIMCTGRDTFPLITDSAGMILAGAGFLGFGRVVTIGHEGLLQSPSAPGLSQFLLNAVAWASSGVSNRTNTVGFESLWSGSATILNRGGYTAVQRSGANNLTGIDVFVTSNYVAYTDDQLSKIHDFVRRGGGLVTGGHAWYWSYSAGNKSLLDDFPGNRLLKPSGLVVLASTVGSGTYDVNTNRANDFARATCALDAYTREGRGETNVMTVPQRNVAYNAIQAVINTVPVRHPLFAEVRAFSSSVGPIVPTESNPVVQSTQPARALAARIQVRVALNSPPEDAAPHPAGNDFPGAVPADTPRVTRTIVIDGTDNGNPMDYNGMSGVAWRSLGLYAAPGDVITVTLDPSCANVGLSVRIGAHSDSLYHLDQWNRMPEIAKQWAITSANMSVASGFGGPLYIVVPAGKNLGPVPVTISGAVEMGWHKQGRDGDVELAQMKLLKAPWFEVEADGYVMTFPSSEVVKQPSLSATQANWSAVLKTYYRLGGYDGSKYRSQRIVSDRQISAGSLHAGYPIMAHLDIPAGALASSCGWGQLHELGHNHQWRDYMLPGSGETVCNIYSVYANEKVCNRTSADAHPNFATQNRLVRRKSWQRGEITDWSVVGLDMYLDLQEGFGWGVFETVMPGQRNRPLAQRPADNDNARVQQWVLDTSRAANANLVSFYRAYKLNVDSGTEAALSSLPAWTNFPLAWYPCGTANVTCRADQRFLTDVTCNIFSNCTVEVCCEALPVTCAAAASGSVAIPPITCGPGYTLAGQSSCIPGKTCDSNTCCRLDIPTCGTQGVACAANQALAPEQPCTPGTNCTVAACCKLAVRVRSVAVATASAGTSNYNQMKATITVEDGNGALITSTTGTVRGDFNSTTPFFAMERGLSAVTSKTNSQAVVLSTTTWVKTTSAPSNTMFCVTSLSFGTNYNFAPNPKKDCSPVMFPTHCGNQEGKQFKYCEFPMINTAAPCGTNSSAPACTYDYCCSFICSRPNTDGYACDSLYKGVCSKGLCVYQDM